jgi:hypothetical protein
VSAVAERLGVSESTVQAAINTGKLRWVLLGSMRRSGRTTWKRMSCRAAPHAPPARGVPQRCGFHFANKPDQAELGRPGAFRELRPLPLGLELAVAPRGAAL